MMDGLRFSDRASDADWAEVLATFSLFAGVGKRHLRKLVRNATFVELARGERIISSPTGSDALYVVLGGDAKMLLPTPRSISTGDYFGELGVLGGRPRRLHVVATRELHVMKLSRQRVLELAARHPALDAHAAEGSRRTASPRGSRKPTWILALRFCVRRVRRQTRKRAHKAAMRSKQAF